MALADRVNAEPKRNPTGRPCSVQELLDNLPTEESRALRHMLDDGWSGARIYAAVTAEGHTVGKQTVNRHRSGACGCFR